MSSENLKLVADLVNKLDTKKNLDDFTEAFKTVVSIFKELKAANIKERADILATCEKKLAEMDKACEELTELGEKETRTMRTEVMDYCKKEMAKMQREQENDLNFLRDKVRSLKDGEDGKDGKDGKDGSPDTPGQIIDKVQSLEEGKRWEIEDVNGLKDLLDELKKLGMLSGGVGNASAFGSALHQPRNERFTMNGTDTTVTLSQGVAANGNAIILRYNGQTQDLDTDFTVSGNKITFVSFTPESGAIISATYWP